MTTERIPLRQKLALLRAYMAELNLPKTGWNNHSQFAYYELGDFMPQALIKMAELKILGTTDFKSDSDFNILRIDDNEDSSQLPIMFYTEKTKASIQGAQPIQNTGGSHTFHRRYLWIDALELSEPDSIDGSKPRQGQTNPESKWINKQDEQKILALKTIADIDAAVKKLLDEGRAIGSDRMKRIEARKTDLKPKSDKKKEEDILYATVAQMNELLATTDIILLKDKKDKILKSGGHFNKIQSDHLSAHYQKLLEQCIDPSEPEAALAELDNIPEE